MEVLRNGGTEVWRYGGMEVRRYGSTEEGNKHTQSGGVFGCPRFDLHMAVYWITCV